MSSGPRVRLSNYNPVKIGLNGGAGTVADFDVDALLATQGNKRVNGAYVTSGGFYVVHTKVKNDQVQYTYRYNGSGGVYTIKGVSNANRPTPQVLLPTSAYPTFAQATAGHSQLAPQGYAKFRPGNPLATLGQFLWELGDLPSIPFSTGRKAMRGIRFKKGSPFRGVPFSNLGKVARDTVDAFRKSNLGSEYLNIKFGWAPFVGDLRKLYGLWSRTDKALAQIVSQNGQWQRRRGTLDSEQVVTPGSVNTYNYAFANCLGAQMPTITDGATVSGSTNIVTTRKWYSAQFRYYIPNIDSGAWRAKARLALFGALPTPELLWEVMPWSWLVDWFVNVGDTMSLISPNAVGYPVTRNQCVMTHVTTTQVSTSTVLCPAANFPPYRVQSPFMGSISTTVITDSKARSGGYSPYGSGSDWSGLSAGQIAILAALGISRAF